MKTSFIDLISKMRIASLIIIIGTALGGYGFIYVEHIGTDGVGRYPLPIALFSIDSSFFLSATYESDTVPDTTGWRGGVFLGRPSNYGASYYYYKDYQNTDTLLKPWAQRFYSDGSFLALVETGLLGGDGRFSHTVGISRYSKSVGKIETVRDEELSGEKNVTFQAMGFGALAPFAVFAQESGSRTFTRIVEYDTTTWTRISLKTIDSSIAIGGETVTYCITGYKAGANGINIFWGEKKVAGLSGASKTTGAFVAAMKPNFDLLWRREVANDKLDSTIRLNDCAPLTNGSMVFIGVDSAKRIILKFSKDGDLVYRRNYNIAPYFAEPLKILETKKGQFFAVGYSLTTAKRDKYIAKFDADGNALWETTEEAIFDERYTGIIEYAPDSYYLFETRPATLNYYRFIDNGLGAEDGEANAPGIKIKVSQVIGDSPLLSVDAGNCDNLSIELINSAGSLAKSIYTGSAREFQDMRIDCANLPNGIYFILARAGKEVATGKICVVK